MKLYINKRQANWHVKVGFNEAYLKKHRHMAQFRSCKMKRDKCFGTIYLARSNNIAVVAHEITHASLHFFQMYGDRKKLEKMDREAFNMCFHESLARGVENMLRDYVKAIGKEKKYSFNVREIKGG